MNIIYPREFPLGTTLLRGERRVMVANDARGNLAFAIPKEDGGHTFRQSLTADPAVQDDLRVIYPGTDAEVMPWSYRTVTVVDTETTGIEPDSKIVEVGILRMRFGKIVERWSSLVNPGIPIPVEATAVHGITNADVANAPTMEQLLPEVNRRINDGVALIGYNIYHADQGWLEQAGVKITIPVIDTLVAVRGPEVGKWWKSDFERRPEDDCPICGGDEPTDEANTRRRVGGRHRLERFGRETGALEPEPGMAELHRALYDCKVVGVGTWVIRGVFGPDAAATEAHLRATAPRQIAELLAFKAKKQSEDAVKRASRHQLEHRVEHMARELLEARKRESELQERLDDLVKRMGVVERYADIAGPSK